MSHVKKAHAAVMAVLADTMALNDSDISVAIVYNDASHLCHVVQLTHQDSIFELAYGFADDDEPGNILLFHGTVQHRSPINDHYRQIAQCEGVVDLDLTVSEPGGRYTLETFEKVARWYFVDLDHISTL